MLEEANGFELFFELLFLLGCDVLEGRSIGSEVEADEFHDAFAADDVAAEMADDVDDLL